MRYVGFIHRENASFGVSFPDFPGCVAVRDTREKAVRQGRKFTLRGFVKTERLFRHRAQSTLSREHRNSLTGVLVQT